MCVNISHLRFMYKKLLAFALISLTLVFISCSDNSPKTIFNNIINNPVNIQDKVESTAIKQNDIKTPLGLACAESMYVIGDEDNNYNLHFYDKTGNRVLDMLPKGHGVNEINSIYQMQSLSTSEFWVLDNSSRKIVTISKDSICDINRMPYISDYHQLTICNDTIVGICVDNDARYKVQNIRTNKAFYMGSYDQYGVTTSVGKNLLQGNIVSNSKTGKFAFLSYYGVSWQFGNYRTKILNKPAIVELPKYSVNGSGYPIMDLGTQLGFISVACSSTHIFALYSGKEIRKGLKNKGEIMHGNIIFQFDWDGNIEKCYKLNEMIYQITYDRTNNKLVMLSENDYGYLIQTLSCI